MKSTVVERLIESWLDSQTERRYQPAFIQLLVSEGWSVLHNTRHSPIELGKDAIARDPAGQLFCFQLKGNPASRVTKTEAQGLLPQVIELIELPPPRSFRTDDDERHIAVFVTNGEVDEEARIVFDAAAERAGKPGVAASAFEIWTRGPILKKLVEKAGAVWPSSVEGTKLILELISADGRETPKPTAVVSALAAAVPHPSTTTSAAAKNAGLSSLFLLAEIIKSAWYRTDNHYSLYAISVLAGVYGLQFADATPRRKTVQQYAALAVEHCADLLKEAQERRFHPDMSWGQTDYLSEFDIMLERRRLVSDCAATLVLTQIDAIPFDREYAALLVNSTSKSPRMWGLGALPALIVGSWARARLNATQEVDGQLAAHLGRLIAISLEKVPNRPPLAAPYYSFEDVWADRMSMPYFTDNSIGKDTFRRRAWFMRAIFYMLAKRNLKQTCRGLWSSFSKLLHEEPDLPPHTFYSPVLTIEGRMQTFTYHHMTWPDLVNEAVQLGDVPHLHPHKDVAWLISAYVVMVPYRASSAVLLWLDTALNDTWYHPGKLPA